MCNTTSYKYSYLAIANREGNAYKVIFVDRVGLPIRKKKKRTES